MKKLMLAIVSTSVLACGCTLFGKKLVMAGEYDEEDEVPSRTSEEMSACFKAVGVSREGLNIADRNVLHMACGDDMHGSSAASQPRRSRRAGQYTLHSERGKRLLLEISSILTPLTNRQGAPSPQRCCKTGLLAGKPGRQGLVEISTPLSGRFCASREKAANH